ncbi:MAG: tRNA (N6-threonylcarbamoyladenosine(37)-N6)-methyltransferase TrmO [Bacteroidota bacterium]
MSDICFQAIGTVHTPYEEKAPFFASEDQEGVFYIDLNPELTDALYLVNTFKYIILLFYIDRGKPHKLRVHPPVADGREVGLFASRSPNRPNPIGMTITRILKIEGNRIYTTGLDILNNTPLLDIKPYMQSSDCKPEANNGWKDEIL